MNSGPIFASLRVVHIALGVLALLVAPRRDVGGKRLYRNGHGIPAVNFDFLPVVVRWLWPTVAGAVCIFIWLRYCTKRFARPAASAAHESSP